MKKSRLTKALILSVLPLSLSAFANGIDVGAGDAELVKNYKTKSGDIVTATYFYNGKWYMTATENDSLFGLKAKYIIRGINEDFNGEKDLAKVVEEHALFASYPMEGEELIYSDEMVMRKTYGDNVSFSVCIKEPVKEFTRLGLKPGDSCDFTMPSSFSETKLNLKDIVDIIGISLNFNEIDFLASEYKRESMSLLSPYNFTNYSIRDNVIFFK